jgi:hypothetical protein
MMGSPEGHAADIWMFDYRPWPNIMPKVVHRERKTIS